MFEMIMVSVLSISTIAFIISKADETKREWDEEQEKEKKKTKNFNYIQNIKLENKKLERKLEEWSEELQQVDKVFHAMREEKKERILTIIKDNDEILMKYIDSNLYTKEKLDRTFSQKIQKDIEKMEKMREETKKELSDEFEKRTKLFEEYNSISRIDQRRHKEEKRAFLIEHKKVPERYRKRVVIMNMKNKEIWKERKKRDEKLVLNLQHKMELMNEVIEVYMELQQEEQKENEWRLDTMYLNIDDLMKMIVRKDLDEELLRRKIDRGMDR